MDYIYAGVIVAVIVFIFVLRANNQGGMSLLHRRIVGCMVVFYGLYLATLTGSQTVFNFPGIGRIALGASTGAAIGLGTYAFLGTVGIATGGVGFAVGAGTMALIGAVFGGAGGASGGFGFEEISYPLVSPFFWIPVVILGIYFFRGKIIQKQKLLPSPDVTPSKESDTKMS